jgi:peptidoglycan/xylan/chitin deacetylase (PgdA/CDA1 family)
VSSVKQMLKRAVRGFAYGTGRMMPPLPGGRILTYHSVGARRHPTNVRPERFREQMEWLAEHARVVTLLDVLQERTGVALTFDDGYRDNLTEAAPVLIRYGFPATVFIVTRHVGGRLPHDDDDPNAGVLTWEDVEALRASGWEIGAHSRTHQRLTWLDAESLRLEVTGSFEDIRDRLATAPSVFAYPYGSVFDFDTEAERMVAETGFMYGLSNMYGTVHAATRAYAVPRINIDATDTLESFAAKVSGRLDPLRWFEARWAARLRRGINRRSATR